MKRCVPSQRTCADEKYTDKKARQKFQSRKKGRDKKCVDEEMHGRKNMWTKIGDTNICIDEKCLLKKPTRIKIKWKNVRWKKEKMKKMRDQKMHNEKLSCKIKLTKKCVQKMSDQKCPTKICHGIPKPMSFCGKKQAEINISYNWIKPPIIQITCIDYSILSPILHHPPTSTHIDICQQHAVWRSSRKRNSVSAESTDIVGELAYGMSQLNYALLFCSV